MGKWSLWLRLRWAVGIVAIAALLAAACFEAIDCSERRVKVPAWQEVR
jgi:hypothetical protein